MALLLAVKTRKVAEVQSALENGAAPDTTDRDGRSAALIAAERGFPEIVQLLVERGTDLNFMQDSPVACFSILDFVAGASPDDGFFAKRKRKNLVRWLRERGALSGQEIGFAKGDDLAGLSPHERLAVLDAQLPPGRREFDVQLIEIFDKMGPELKKRRVG